MPKFLHPAVDYVDGKLWFGIYWPDDEGKHRFHLVNSDGRIVDPEDEEQMGDYILRTTPAYMFRWSERGVRRFLDGGRTEGVLEKIVALERRYLELQDPREYQLLAVWIIGTYFFPIFRTYAYLSLSGLKRSGKSKVLDFLSLLCFNAVNAADVSDSSIYRLCEAVRATLLMDEAHALETREAKAVQKNLLYCGYRRGKKVYRTDKTPRGIVPVAFDVYGPKAFVTFRGAEDILADRAIPIVMLRSTSEVADMDMREDDPVWEETRDDLYIWAMRNHGRVKEVYDGLVLDRLHGRHRELWAPLLSLAKVLDPGLFEQLYDLAVEKCAAASEEDQLYREIKVLEALILITKDWKEDTGLVAHTRVKEVAHTLLEAEEDRKYLTSQVVSKVMAGSFGFKSEKVGRRVMRRVSRSKVLELARRYGVDPEKVLMDEREVLRRFLSAALQGERRWEVLCQKAESMGFRAEEAMRVLDELSEGEYLLAGVCPDEEGERGMDGRRRCTKLGVRCGVMDPDRCPLRR